MKLLKRVLLGLLIMFAALVVFLAGSILLDSLLGSDRLQSVTNTTIAGAAGGPDLRAYVARPAGEGSYPAVIMIHEFYGLNESIVSKADLLAEDGYLVIAPDTFRGSSTSWIPRAIYQVISSRPENVNADLDSVYAWLESQPEVDASRPPSQASAMAGFAGLQPAQFPACLHGDLLWIAGNRSRGTAIPAGSRPRHLWRGGPVHPC